MTKSWILPNVRKAVAQAIRYGCTHIRAFADVDCKARLEGVKALLQGARGIQGRGGRPGGGLRAGRHRCASRARPS